MAKVGVFLSFANDYKVRIGASNTGAECKRAVVTLLSLLSAFTEKDTPGAGINYAEDHESRVSSVTLDLYKKDATVSIGKPEKRLVFFKRRDFFKLKLPGDARAVHPSEVFGENWESVRATIYLSGENVNKVPNYLIVPDEELSLSDSVLSVLTCWIWEDISSAQKG